MAAHVRVGWSNRQLAAAGLAFGPVLLIAGLLIGVRPGIVGQFLPLEPAWIQGAISLPMLLLAPALLSLGWMDEPSGSLGARIALGIALLIGAGIAAWTALNVSQIGCTPVTNPIQALPVGAIWGGIAGIGFFLAVRAGRGPARDGRPFRALVAGVSTGIFALFVDIGAFVVLFPPLLCAPPHG